MLSLGVGVWGYCCRRKFGLSGAWAVGRCRPVGRAGHCCSGMGQDAEEFALMPGSYLGCQQDLRSYKEQLHAPKLTFAR